MDMDEHSMHMSGTTSAAIPSSTPMDIYMGGHGGEDSGGHGGMGGCQISMLWNWNTIDSCFISSSWRITSSGMFAGSCIGVILLVITLEFLRRAVKEYDRYLIRKNTAAAVATTNVVDESSRKDSDKGASASSDPMTTTVSSGYRPKIFEQAIRALLHMMQFAVAYFIMLLAMYYNGYIIICIFIGAYLGSFIFHWETLGAQDKRQTSASNEATVCCG